MRQAEKRDLTLVVNIITEAFIDNPSVNSVIAPNAKHKKRRIEGLAKYVFLTAFVV